MTLVNTISEHTSAKNATEEQQIYVFLYLPDMSVPGSHNVSLNTAGRLEGQFGICGYYNKINFF